MIDLQESILLYGAGGHAKVVADVLERQQKKIIGFLDDNSEIWGKEVFGYKVLGGFDLLKGETLKGHTIIASIGSNEIRKMMVAKIEELGLVFNLAIHPSAQISRDVTIGAGTMIMANVAINPGTIVGKHAIINTSASIDHDCIIGDFAHISPRVALAGNICIGEQTQVGIGSCVIPGITIGANCLIGAGSVVTKDIPDGKVAVGVPARPIKDTRLP